MRWKWLYWRHSSIHKMYHLYPTDMRQMKSVFFIIVYGNFANQIWKINLSGSLGQCEAIWSSCFLPCTSVFHMCILHPKYLNIYQSVTQRRHWMIYSISNLLPCSYPGCPWLVMWLPSLAVYSMRFGVEYIHQRVGHHWYRWWLASWTNDDWMSMGS